MNTTQTLGMLVADEALHVVTTARHTRYQHDAVIDEATQTYDVDCSGFVSYLLGKIAPKHLDLIPTPPAHSRLLAADYHRFFASLPAGTAGAWRRITTVQDALRGDLIAWALTPPNHDTGHIFVVAEPPATVDVDTWAVPAYDASDIRHYEDSRGPRPAQFRTGVGAGTFHLRVNPAGVPVGFQFGPGDPFFLDGIVVARVERDCGSS